MTNLKIPSVSKLVYIPTNLHWHLRTPFEWDTAVQVVQENNRQRVLFDSKFKYIREMIVSTNTHDEDEG